MILLETNRTNMIDSAQCGTAASDQSFGWQHRERAMDEHSAAGGAVTARPPSADMGNEEIHASIFEAIVDHRLLPGTHLKEDELCEIYGVGRTRMRAILSRLAADHVVELVSNRGAFVSRPTIEEAREVFRARRLIEGHLVRRAATNLNSSIREALEHHLVHEATDRDGGDQSAVIKRCGNYHQVIADQADSPIIARFLRELIARSSLIVAIYEVKPPDECELEEHRELTNLILAGRADDAVALMDQHLSGIEDRLDLLPKRKGSEDLRRALGASRR